MELTRETRDRRVAIAQDVLLQMDREDCPLRPERERYIYGAIEIIPPETSVQSAVDQIQSGCAVCGIGAVFLSYQRLFNGAKVDDISIKIGESTLFRASKYEIQKAVEDTFDQETINVIEMVFEEWGYWRYGNRTPDEALRYLMENIVANDGILTVGGEEL